MSDTPETDAMVEESFHRINFPTAPVPADFARKLERERDEALMDRANGDIATMTRNHYERILRERNEAREKLDEEMKWHHRTHTELVQTQCKILDMQMGRDEIQEKYDNLATEHMLAVNKLCEERDEAREQINRYRYNLDLLPIKWDI